MRMRNRGYNGRAIHIGTSRGDIRLIGGNEAITTKLYGEQKTTRPRWNSNINRVIKRMQNRTIVFK